MKTTADILWIWLLGHVICSVTGALLPQEESQSRDPAALSNLNKILIYGGYECQAHSQPWMAVLLSRYKVLCGGVLVHPQWVLSSAECHKSSYTIGLGLHSLDPKQQQGSQVVEATFSIRHPEFNPVKDIHNLLLIKLNTSVVESDTIRPINISSQCPSPGTRCLFSGWGWVVDGMQSQFLKCMDTTVVSTETCKTAYPWGVFEGMLCAGGETWNKGTCKGDAGGPLVCNGVLQGINVRSGTHCGRMGDPDVYVKLCEYKKWIEKVMETQ